jgi:putative flippase GtrA
MDAGEISIERPAAAWALGRASHRRFVAGIRRRANWTQLLRFGLVGASGYAVNLAAYAICVHALGLDYRVSATAAFVLAVANNFALNRRWTFSGARHGNAGFQAARFLLVSVAVFGVQLALLTALVEGAHVSRVLGQALAIACCTPLNFLGNKLWSFRIAAV